MYVLFTFQATEESVFHNSRKSASNWLCRNGLHSSCSVGVSLPLVPAVSPTSPHLQPHASSLESLRLVSCAFIPTSATIPVRSTVQVLSFARDVSWLSLLPYVLVQARGAVSPYCNLSRKRFLSRGFWRIYRFWCWTHEWARGVSRMAMAFHTGRHTIMPFRRCDLDDLARLAGVSEVAECRGKEFGCWPGKVLWVQRGRQGHDMGGSKVDVDGVAALCSLSGTISNSWPWVALHSADD